MPYKDSEKRKQASKDSMERKRKGLTLGINKEGVNIELFEGKPRFLKLSDGQVFDRTYQPEPNKHIPEMIAGNREIDLSRGISKVRRIALLVRALEKTMTGLDGKSLKLGTLVRYGVAGLTFEEIGSPG